jgi:hypothetical protein
MRPFPHLHTEQDSLIEQLEDWGRNVANPEAEARVSEICRQATHITQVRIEILYPSCVGRAHPALIDASIIDLDLARVLIFELLNTQPTAFLYPSFVSALQRLLCQRFSQEERSDGLWASAVAGGLDPGPVDVAIGARLLELNAGEPLDRQPLMPHCLETLRDSVPDAVRFRNIKP